MNDERYDLYDLLLAGTEAPEHRPDFFRALDVGLSEADWEMGRRGRGRFGLPRRSPLPPLRLALAAAAVLAVCVFVAAAALLGVPGTSTVTGPETVSAAQVIKTMLRSLANVHTLQADSTDWIRTVTATGSIRYVETHHRVSWSADGSTRFVLTDRPQRLPARLRDRPDENDFAYDARHGVYYDYYRGWNSDLGMDGEYEDRYAVVRHFPLGPPDGPPTVAGFDFSASARAQEVAREATVTTATYQGRPAWIIAISTRRLLGRWANEESLRRWAPPVSGEEIGLTTVDRETGLPVRFQVMVGGVLQFEYRWTDIKVDAPLPADAFTVHRPKGARLVRVDAGYHRLPIATIAKRAPRTTLVPQWIPGGYVKLASTYSPRAFTSTWTTTSPASYGRDVVAIRYARGFDNLTVTTRVSGNPALAMEGDPVMDDTAWVRLVSKKVPVTRGWFAGATARVVIGPRATTPHLWVTKDGLLLTVAGSASVEELVRVAESMKPYASGSAP